MVRQNEQLMVATLVLAASTVAVALYQPFNNSSLANCVELASQSLLLVCLVVASTFFAGVEQDSEGVAATARGFFVGETGSGRESRSSSEQNG